VDGRYGGTEHNNYISPFGKCLFDFGFGELYVERIGSDVPEKARQRIVDECDQSVVLERSLARDSYDPGASDRYGWKHRRVSGKRFLDHRYRCSEHNHYSVAFGERFFDKCRDQLYVERIGSDFSEETRQWIMDGCDEPSRAFESLSGVAHDPGARNRCGGEHGRLSCECLLDGRYGSPGNSFSQFSYNGN